MLLVPLAVYILRAVTSCVALEAVSCAKNDTGGKCNAEVYRLVGGHDVAAQSNSRLNELIILG